MIELSGEKHLKTIKRNTNNPLTDLDLLAYALESLKECVPDPDIDFGPAYELACKRRELVIRTLKIRLQL